MVYAYVSFLCAIQLDEVVAYIFSRSAILSSSEYT